MNVLFDINHPAHLHLFRNAIKALKDTGHSVTITARNKDITIQLLNNYQLDYILLSKAKSGLLGLGFELLLRQFKLLPILIKRKIDICVSVTGACNVHVAKLLGIPSLIFYDTEHAKLQNSIAYPFATKVITPESYNKPVGKNHLTYKGFHDLAYLHPKYFTADKSIYDVLKLTEDEKFVILRFVSWGAAHDIGHSGISLEVKRQLITTISKYTKVLISSESQLPEEFEPYRIAIPPERMHDALCFAHLYLGEGGSMATEAAVLGTPSIFVSTLPAGVFDALEQKYKLLLQFKPSQNQQIIDKTESILKDSQSKAQWVKQAANLTADCIDVTQFITETILKYGKTPKSKD